LIGQRLHCFEALRTGEAQGHLTALVETLMETAQRRLKFRLWYSEAVAIASVKAPQRMSRRQSVIQGNLVLGGGVPGPGDEFGVQYFPLA
jgi:hypothetical protein